MQHVNNPNNSEVDAYTYIKTELQELGWITKNPSRFSNGEVYKQNECLSNVYIKEVLFRDMPEAIVKIDNEHLWVIESKRNKTSSDLERAINELKNQYAEKINKSKFVKCNIISAVAGNDSDGYLISNQYYCNGEWKLILKNGYEKTSLLTKEEINNILQKKSPNIDDKIEFSESKFLTTAENINKILHLSAINKSKRARFIAGIVLCFASKNEIQLNLDITSELVEHINVTIKNVLKNYGKEDFFEFIKLQIPPNEENHIKYRDAIIRVYRELTGLDIKSAMNSGHDVLGKFYEVFLKYGNGAKEIGIVLTPRHIAKFAAEVLDIRHNDIVFDPTCGTGGFLVAALDYVKQNNQNEEQLKNFKKNNIFGVEQEDDVMALALVNMIFRGDGRNNIKNGNCFNNWLKKKLTIDGQISAEYFNPKETDNKIQDKVVSKVMMNPPFALKKSDEKESNFVDFALAQMEDGGILFAILPISVLYESASENWRKNILLKNNTLLSVVTFPEDLFNPSASVGTVGIFVKKGIPHNYSNKIYFARAITDGFVIKKGKRLFNEKNENKLKEIEQELKSFINNQNQKIDNIPEFKMVCELNENDTYCELVPEMYIESKIPNEEDVVLEIDNMIREAACYLIRTKK